MYNIKRSTNVKAIGHLFPMRSDAGPTAIIPPRLNKPNQANMFPAVLKGIPKSVRKATKWTATRKSPLPQINIAMRNSQKE